MLERCMELPRVQRHAILTALIACLAVGVLASAAVAAPKPIEPADLSGLEAKRRVVDTILEKPPQRARAASTQRRVQQWADTHGRTITIATDLPAVDLSPFASILAGTLHGDEIETLGVTAVLMAEIGSICGSPEAVACYAPDDPESTGAGQMWFAVDDPDVAHTVVHEYGHHIDNQLVNFGHFGGACGWDNDGSRAWFFARDLEDDILGAGATCLADSGWEYQLAELYAEDFVALNGILAWELPTFRSPTAAQLKALAYDLLVPFEPASRVWKPRVRFKREPYRTITLHHWTFLTLTMKSPRRRDFDLYLYRAGKTRWLARSTRGRFDRIERVLRPGSYDVGVYGYRGGGRANVAIVMD